MLLVHARGASKGLGEPSVNRNNHPFVNTDYSIGLVHNGRVDDTEYAFLKKQYGVQSQCDSEILLRIFEAGETYGYSYLKKILANVEHPQRFAGIKDIFSNIVEGHMAVAVAERGLDKERMLWLFRNKHRPLWIVDMRAYLGQIFFVSEPNIWEEAAANIGIKHIIKTQKLIELPTEEVWFFKIDNDESYPKNVKKYEVVKGTEISYGQNSKFCPVIKKPPKFKVITQLNENDQILKTYREFPEIVPQPDSSLNDAYIKVYKKCDELITVIESIRGSSYNLKEEGSISCHDMQQLLQELEQQCQYLNELKTIIA